MPGRRSPPAKVEDTDLWYKAASRLPPAIPKPGCNPCVAPRNHNTVGVQMRNSPVLWKREEGNVGAYEDTGDHGSKHELAWGRNFALMPPRHRVSM